MATKVVEVPLDFTNLTKLDDGRIDKLLKHHLSIAARDCINRPGDKNARKVTLEFICKPQANPEGDAETASVELECKSKVPIYRSRSFEMRLNNGGFTYNQDFPNDLSQPSLFPDGESQEETDE